MTTIEDFNTLDIRVGKIVDVQDFPDARKPMFKLTIDFGPKIGVKRSGAQVTVNYTKKDLLGKPALAVVNFPPRQIGSFLSEVLTLGVPDEKGEVVPIEPDRSVPLGGRLY